MANQDLFQVFITTKTLPQFRALRFADIADGMDSHLGILLDILQILLCQVAVANDGNILLVIALAAVITEDSPTEGSLGNNEKTREKPEKGYCQAWELHDSGEVQEGHGR